VEVTASRLIMLVGVLLIGGFVWSFRQPVPGIHGTATAPVKAGELWNLNP